MTNQVANREEALRLVENFKETIFQVNVPNEQGKSTIASAEWTNSYFQAIDSLKDIGL